VRYSPRETHRELREQLGVFALGHGDAEERATVRSHLNKCAACRAELDELTKVVALLAAVSPANLGQV
jgi:anti-sigma factor RsiW